MTDPSKFDDDWAELARELERDKLSSPPLPTEGGLDSDKSSVVEENELNEHLSEQIEETGGEEFEDAGDETLESDSEAESSGEFDSADGQPGTGKKRRRRRRRRRKGGGQPAEVGSNDEPDTEKTDSGEAETEELRFGTEPASDEMDFQDELADEGAEDLVNSSNSDLEEDSGGELLRELIANWNVPSWDDVVAGLYRPER